MWSVNTKEYYSAITKNERMPSAATWVSLGIVTLSESVRQRQIYPSYVQSNFKK